LKDGSSINFTARKQQQWQEWSNLSMEYQEAE
jgi:hypothetical protein